MRDLEFDLTLTVVEDLDRMGSQPHQDAWKGQILIPRSVARGFAGHHLVKSLDDRWTAAAATRGHSG